MTGLLSDNPGNHLVLSKTIIAGVRYERQRMIYPCYWYGICANLKILLLQCNYAVLENQYPGAFIMLCPLAPGIYCNSQGWSSVFI